MTGMFWSVGAAGLLAFCCNHMAISVRNMNLRRGNVALEYGDSFSVPVPPGPEDLIVTRDGDLVVSCDARATGHAGTNGSLVRVDVHAPQEQHVLWMANNGEPFHPHGIDYFVDADGREYLYVINHAGPQDSVMIFLLEGKSVTLLRSIVAPGCTTLNDLTALSPTQFYVTSDHNTRSPFWNRVSDYLRLPTGYVLYFDGNCLSRAASGISFANGIQAIDGGNRLCVAAMLCAELRIYERTSPSGKLRQSGRIPLDGCPDNITITREGGVVVAVHPQILKLAGQEKNRKKKAPSAVRYVSPAALNGNAHVKALYDDPGGEISAASVAVQVGERLYIGSVYDDHVLVCDRGGQHEARLSQ